jgi:hypothetical protein
MEFISTLLYVSGVVSWLVTGYLVYFIYTHPELLKMIEMIYTFKTSATTKSSSEFFSTVIKAKTKNKVMKPPAEEEEIIPENDKTQTSSHSAQ